MSYEETIIYFVKYQGFILFRLYLLYIKVRLNFQVVPSNLSEGGDQNFTILMHSFGKNYIQ